MFAFPHHQLWLGFDVILHTPLRELRWKMDTPKNPQELHGTSSSKHGFFQVQPFVFEGVVAFDII